MNDCTEIANSSLSAAPASIRRLLVVGAFVTGLGVALGAFGAHLLEGHLQRTLSADLAARRLDTWEVGVRYQLVHGLALLLLGILSRQFAPEDFRWPSRLLLAGTAVFSGSLYALVLLDMAMFGAITPLGGLLLLGGWCLLGVSCLRRG